MPPVAHVLMTADAVGGVWTFTVDLARTLAARGVRVTVAVMGPAPSADQSAMLVDIPGVSCAHRPYRLEWMERPWDDVDAAGEWLLSLAEQNRPDVVHLNGFCHAALDWGVPVLVAGHSCVLSWWRAVRGEEAPAEWGTYAERVNRGLCAADLVTAPTGAMLEELDRHYGPLTLTRVIPNGRTLPQVECPAKEPFVLTAGRLWDEAKNVSAVCRVAPRLPWPVRVAGDTRAPGGDEVRCDGVDYLGRLDTPSLSVWMRRASIYALPARYEPFGLSALEAALAGCALVLGDIRSLREVWGDAALYVPPDNAALLASALRLLIDDAPFRADLAARALACARTLTPERMADGYLDAYTAVASSGRLVSSLAS